MAAATLRPKLSPQWKKFVATYSANHAYWYQPKGLAVTVEAVEARLAPLKEFEGTRPWKDCQADYVKRLNDLGVSKADGPALGRMLKQVLTVLGLAWVDPNELVEITPAGTLFLNAPNSEEKAAVLAKQSLRYQFWNPSIGSRTHAGIHLHPVPFLVRLLQTIDGPLATDEYDLFAAKAAAIGDVDRVADQIESYRTLAKEVRAEISRQCLAFQIGGSKRGSMLETLQKNRSYAMRMWTLSDLLDGDGRGGLQLRKSALRGPLRAWLDDYAANGTYIEFDTEKAFLAWMGDVDLRPNEATALDIYTSRGDVDAAAGIKKRMGASAAEVGNFRRMLMTEKQLEDQIETNWTNFSKFVGRDLKFIARQYETTVGPIDILALDRKSGRYVVIELKKGRAADKVFGQLSRYMGWVRKNLAKGGDVDGMIVGSEIDDKLRAARDAHPGTKVALVTYNGKVSFSVE